MIDPGEILRACRAHANYSQMSLSVESGISQTTIQEIESGKRDCRVSTLEALLNTMGYELEVLQSEE